MALQFLSELISERDSKVVALDSLSELISDRDSKFAVFGFPVRI